LDRCFFCGGNNPIVLEEHHLVLGRFQEKLGVSDESTVILCRNCHRKVHYVLIPIEYVVTGEILLQLENSVLKPEESAESVTNDLDGLEDKGRREKILEKVRQIIRDLKVEMGPIPKKFIIERVKQENISETVLEWALMRLYEEGFILNPSRLVRTGWLFYGPTEQYDVDMYDLSKGQRDKMEILFNIIETLEERTDAPVPLEVIIEKAKLENVDADFVNRALIRLKKDGLLFEPKPGFIKRAVDV